MSLVRAQPGEPRRTNNVKLFFFLSLHWVETLKKCKAGEFTVPHTEPEVQEQLDSYRQEKNDLKALHGVLGVKADYVSGRTTINSKEVELAIKYVERFNELLSHRLTADSEHKGWTYTGDDQSYEAMMTAGKEYIRQRDILLEEFKLKKVS